MTMSSDSKSSRREFLATSAAVTAAVAIGAPAVATASKSDSKTILGHGDYRYEIQHDWPQLPSKYHWQTTHNVSFDREGNLYVIHNGDANLKDHPSIFVFDADGKFIRAFGEEFQGGGHGMEVRQEGNEEFVYVAANQNVSAISKLSLTGERVWYKKAPMEAGCYAEGEDQRTVSKGGRDRFMPTNFAFLDNGDFYVADGYGSFYVHRYDKDGNWLSSFGGPGEGKGTFNSPHGLWVDNRPGREERLVVCDRGNRSLQYLTFEGEHLETLSEYELPCNLDLHEDLMLMPELTARVTILGKNNEVVAHLGDDIQRVKSKQVVRTQPKTWSEGRFVHPHDACFDTDGNIFVAEWVSTGRVSKLQRLG
ncbi:twin-arginine translocation signal domain-containing protein [Calycomorphotria hydatis]|uniref:NHL repeat protein n=1 Tax=Calycomorphotria hydatis TaxID=2528027 RepID=A0A517T5R8_9PLAN|nr:twin-arginine translocation signal domain-containing protein [Calycomorphotria hydatis]QDT63725.1 NHL repeat protein [Calycomorphotria hydatis]